MIKRIELLAFPMSARYGLAVLAFALRCIFPLFVWIGIACDMAAFASASFPLSVGFGIA